MAAGDLELSLTDVRGSDLHDTIRIELFDAQGNCDYRNRKQVRRQITLTGIECGPLAFYRVAVTPTRYRTRQTFVAIKEGKTATVNLSFPVEPRKVKDIQAHPFPDLAASLQAVLEISDIPAYRDGKGNPLVGAPNLTDKIWLYGPDKVTIMQGIQNGRGAVMPAWNGRLSESIIKALTVYVYSFGGGEK